MAKILISPLGTGRLKEGKSFREYEDTKYSLNNGERIVSSSFVSSVLADELEIDKIIFIGTSKSMWEEVYRYFSTYDNNKADDGYWLELHEKIAESDDPNKVDLKEDKEKLGYTIDKYLKARNPEATGGSKIKIIDYGLNEDEIWNNLDIIMSIDKYISDGDEIYLDITHSFRSIPLLIYILIDFMKTLGKKNIEVAGIYYGMFEAKSENKNGEKYVPIVNLGPLFKVSDMTRATHDFLNYGNSYMLADTLADEISEKTQKSLRDISDTINMNYLIDFENDMNSFKYSLKNEHGGNLLKYIRPDLEQFIDRFSKEKKTSDSKKDSSDIQLELSLWYWENRKYGYTYICLVEAILTKLCIIYGKDESNYSNREIVKAIFYKEARDWINKNDEKDLIETKKEIKKLDQAYHGINKVRQSIAHANFEDKNNNRNFKKEGSDYTDSNKIKEDIEKIRVPLMAGSLRKLPDLISFDKLKAFKK